MNRLAQAFACYVTDRSLHEALVVGWTRRFLGVNLQLASKDFTAWQITDFVRYMERALGRKYGGTGLYSATSHELLNDLSEHAIGIVHHTGLFRASSSVYIRTLQYMYRLYSCTHRKRQGRLLSLDGSWRFSFYLVVFWLSAFLSTREAIVSKHMHTRHYQCMLCAVIIVPAVLCHLQFTCAYQLQAFWFKTPMESHPVDPFFYRHVVT